MPAFVVHVANLPDDALTFVYYHLRDQPGVLGVMPITVDESALAEQIRAFVPSPIIAFSGGAIDASLSASPTQPPSD